MVLATSLSRLFPWNSREKLWKRGCGIVTQTLAIPTHYRPVNFEQNKLTQKIKIASHFIFFRFVKLLIVAL